MRLVHYLAIYLPSVVILITFYLLIEIVLFLRRKDRILGTTFFKITFVLGLAEISEVIAIHFLHLFPINGLFLDQIYLKWGAPFPAICNYTVIALGTVQFMLISICSLNRFFVILGSTGAKKDFYDKVTWILMFVLTFISALFYTPIFFAADSMYVDMRNNETNPDDLIMACRCAYTNDQLNNINQLFLLVVKGSNVVFALAVYSCIFIMSIVTKRPAMSKENAKNRGREAKLAIAVFIHTIIAGSSLFLLIGYFYIWPNNFSLIIPVASTNSSRRFRDKHELHRWRQDGFILQGQRIINVVFTSTPLSTFTPSYPSNGLTSNHARVIIAASLGTVFEWYDFLLYMSLAAIIAEHFFTPLSSGSAFVMALFTFAAGFAVRPFGAIVFGRLGDKVGRKYTFLATIIIMGAATFLVGVLPTYSTMGLAAPIILVILRCLQGLAVGGEYGGAVTYVAEHAPPGKRGLYTSFIQATASFGFLLSLLVNIIIRSVMGEDSFKAWGWRIPFLISVLLLGVSVFIRMKLHESPIFKEMKSLGKTSKSPLKESFCNLKNLKFVVLALFGAVAGQGVVVYTSHFYAFYFLTQTLKVDAVAANIFLAIALVFSFFGYIFFGWLSDKIGRKPIVLTGCFLAAVTYYHLFMALTHFANPDLEYAMRKNPAVVIADPSDCSFQFVPGELKGHVKFTSSCDLLKNLLNSYSVSYSNEEAPKGSLAIVKFGNKSVSSVSIQGMTPKETSYVQGNLTANVKQAIIDAGYPLKADPSKVDKVLLEIVMIILSTFVTMVYGPSAAWLVELFPTRIRYTSMSLPYHIGSGWIGGFLPTVGFAVVLLSGNIYLAYGILLFLLVQRWLLGHCSCQKLDMLILLVMIKKIDMNVYLFVFSAIVFALHNTTLLLNKLRKRSFWSATPMVLVVLAAPLTNFYALNNGRIPLFSCKLKKPHRNSLEGVRERLKTLMLQTKMIALYSFLCLNTDTSTPLSTFTPSYPSNGLTSNHARVIIAASLGTVFEWYDFVLYGSLASIIAEHFFTSLPSGSAFVMALFTFAAGFAVRPFGAIVFGRLGDKVGRKYTFLATIIIMGAATFLVGVLPTYATLGYTAPIMLVILRCLQGLAIGGEYGGAATYVAEHAPPGKRGLYTSFIQATASFGLLLSLIIIVIIRSIIGEDRFTAWGWRIPFLISVLLLGFSVFIRMKLHESPIFKEMKSLGKTSKSPLKESFCNLNNLKFVVLALFGSVTGQTVVVYTSHFYAFYFLTQTLKLDAVAANIFLAIALVFSIFGYIFFGWLSDKIGRKPIVLTGCFLAALTYYPLFMALTHFANPDLEYAMRKNPAVVIADPTDCSFQFVPGELKGHVKFTSSCDLLKNLLNSYSVSYSNEEAPKGSLAIVKFGNKSVSSVSIQGMTPKETSYVQGNLTANVKQAIIDAGYPLKADPSKVDKVLLEIVMIILSTFVTMVYGPSAAWLVELFPTKIRYTSMSLPYHIGCGWIGGFLPTVGFAVVLLSGNIYAGLWYPIIFASATVVIGALFLPETRHVDITSDDQGDRYECLPLRFLRDRFCIRQYNFTS